VQHELSVTSFVEFLRLPSVSANIAGAIFRVNVSHVLRECDTFALKTANAEVAETLNAFNILIKYAH
jgi:hypothetical protein